MKRCLAIAKRDISSFFRMPRGYALLGAFTGLWGFYFFNILGRYNFLVSRALGMQLDSKITIPTLQLFVIQPYFHMVLVSFIFLIPLLAMRSLAGERISGTFELLSTSPGDTLGLVFGKFLALVFLVLCFTTLAAIYPYSLVFFGNPDCGVILGGTIGIFLCGVAFAALALTCGARTEHQMLAATYGSLLLAFLLLLHTPLAILTLSWRRVFEPLSALLETQSFIQGQISLQGIVYFGLLILLGLSVTNLSLKLEKQSPPKDRRLMKVVKGIEPAKLLLFGILLLVGGFLLGIVQGNFFSPYSLLHYLIGCVLVICACWGGHSRLPGLRALLSYGLRVATSCLIFWGSIKSHYTWDISDLRTWTLSAHTHSVLQQLSKPLEITYILQGDLELDSRATRFLELIVAARPNDTRLQFIDPADYPNLSSSLGIMPGDLIQLAYGVSEPGRRVRLKEISQDAIASSLSYLALSNQPKIYLLESSGTRLSDTSQIGISKYATALMREGFAVESINDNRIPEDAAALMLIAPRSPIPMETLEALRNYILNGGRLLVAADPLFNTSLNSLLLDFGVNCSNAVIIDKDQAVFSKGRAGLQPLVRNLADHPITNQLGTTRAIIMNVVSSCAKSPNSSKFNVQELAWTSPGSIADENIMNILNGLKSYTEALGRPSYDHLSVAAAVTNSKNQPQLVVFGDSDWLLNTAFEYYANRDLALNSIQWLLGNNWALVPRDRNQFNSTVALSSSDLSFLMTLSILLSEILILMGLLHHLRAQEL